MTPQEKLELARDWYNDKLTTNKEKLLLENLFPELKEYNDEMIRKEMIDFIQETIDTVGESPNVWTMSNAKKWLAWLERQNKETPQVITDSESDKIRKNIKIALMSMEDNLSVFYSTHHTSQKELLDWLEKQGEQKSAWSEDDEIGYNGSLWAIKQARTIAKDENDMGDLWYAERWLKSLKGKVQPHWKPTKEQLMALRDAIDNNEMESLYNELKKL